MEIRRSGRISIVSITVVVVAAVFLCSFLSEAFETERLAEPIKAKELRRVGFGPEIDLQVFRLDDGTAEIFTGSRTGRVIIANRYEVDLQCSLSTISFYTGKSSTGMEVDVVVYEAPPGFAAGPDWTMEVWRQPVVLEGGYQQVRTGGVVVNEACLAGSAFFVGLAEKGEGSFSLGIDRSGEWAGSSYLSEDGGVSFAPLSEWPIIEGNAMIRASEGPVLMEAWDRLWRRAVLHRAIGRDADVLFPPMGRAAAPGGHEIELTPPRGGEQETARQADVLINDYIRATSGSGSCPGCDPDYPSFTLGPPDFYEDYITLENDSNEYIQMPIEVKLSDLDPVQVEAYNPDGGGFRPPTAFWEYSLARNDGTDSTDDVLEPGEWITRKWRIKDDGGEAFSLWANVFAQEILLTVSMTYCQTVHNLVEDTLALPEFDPSMGTLVDVDFSFEIMATHDLFIENQGATPTSDLWIDSYFFSRFTVPGLGTGPVEVEAVSHVSEVELAEYDGVTDYGGDSGVSFNGISVYARTDESPQELDPYIGTELFEVALSGGFARYESGHEGSEPTWQSEQSIGVQVCVTYTYEPDAHIVVPTPDHPTIQRGINDLAEGGTIVIEPGTYNETLRIEGKRVNIVGSGIDGRSAVEIIGTDPEAATITFGAAGGGQVRNLTISGGAYGIAGETGHGEVMPDAVSLQDMLIEQTGRGIYGDFSILSGFDLEIRDTSWNGMSILNVALLALGVTIYDTGNVGCLIYNTQASSGLLHAISGEISGNPQGGIVVLGGALPVLIWGCKIFNNGVAGIYLYDTGHVMAQNNEISDTYYWPPGSRLSDGALIWSSEPVTMLDSTFENNERAGITIVGCDPDDHSYLAHGNLFICGSAFEFEVYICDEQAQPCTSGYKIDYLGGTTCGDQCSLPGANCHVYDGWEGLGPPQPLE